MVILKPVNRKTAWYLVFFYLYTYIGTQSMSFKLTYLLLMLPQCKVQISCSQNTRICSHFPKWRTI